MRRRTTVRAAALLAIVALAAACGSEHAAVRSTTTIASPTPVTEPAPTLGGRTDQAVDSTPREFASPDRPCGTLDTPPAKYDHVIWIWMENHSAAQVIGTAAAPFITSLATKCATATNYRSVGKPSLPNYIGATSGDTSGIADDAGPAAHHLTTDNLFRQVRAAGGTAVSYQDGMSANCQLGGGGRYGVKHNPAAYYVGADDRTACGTDDVPFSPNFTAAVQNDTLPTFAFVTPDLCNDTHDCPVHTGDEWLSRVLTELLDSPAYHAGRTAIFLVWDEDAPMPFVAMTPSVRPGTVLTTPVNHYALLRTTEEMLGISTYLGNAASATSMRTGLHL